jgi:hypothetical protein
MLYSKKLEMVNQHKTQKYLISEVLQELDLEALNKKSLRSKNQAQQTHKRSRKWKKQWN